METTAFTLANTSRVPQDGSASSQSTDQETAPLFVPMNVASRIFSYLRRDDLDRCLLVCHQWNWLVNYNNRILPWRTIDCVVLSTNKEFTIKVAYGQRLQTHVFKKYFRDRDIDAHEVHKDQRLQAPFSRKRFEFGCHARLVTGVCATSTFPNPGRFHHSSCKPRRSHIHKSHICYGSKLFTPPLAFYERLEFVLRNCRVNTLILRQFTMTDLFVEKFYELLGGALEVEHLHLHDVKLRYVTPQCFHGFLSEAVLTRQYFIESLRYALPEHIHVNLLNTEAIKRAKIFYVGHSTSRYDTELRFSITDEEFFSFVTAQPQDESDYTGREFFGIALSRVSDKITEQYQKLYTFSSKKSLLYPHILFDTHRYIAPDYAPPAEIPREQTSRYASQAEDFLIVRNHSMLDARNDEVLDLFPSA